jgi:4-hydroxy-3-methylbut-2-enyl diphosphate reductase
VRQLLVLAPMAVEAAAVRNAGRVLRTGIGPERARIAAARALAVEADGIAVAGLCGGVDERLRTGDVVCATELRRVNGAVVPVPGSALLVGALRRLGLEARVGPIVSTDRILPPPERAGLGDALAVDMESAWLADAAGTRPFAVLRVVVDAADRRLTDPRIVVDGVEALRALRRSAGALADWARALGPRRVVIAEPRSFLGGTGDAVDIVKPVILVAGSKSAESSKQLVQAARRTGAHAHLVADETDLDVAWLHGAATVVVTGEAPERLVDALGALGPVEVEERATDWSGASLAAEAAT